MSPVLNEKNRSSQDGTDSSNDNNLTNIENERKKISQNKLAIIQNTDRTPEQQKQLEALDQKEKKIIISTKINYNQRTK